MKLSKIWLLSVCLVVSFVWCVSAHAGSVDVEFDKKGVYVAWFVYPVEFGIRGTEPVRILGDKGSVSDPDVIWSSDRDNALYIMDRKTGNVAVFPPSDNDTVSASEDDFKFVGTVILHIVAEDGSPVESALVRVMDSNGEEFVSTLTPSDTGDVVLHNVAAGQMNIKVKTEGLKKTIDSDLELPLERDTPAFRTDVRVSGDVNTVAVSQRAEREPKRTRDTRSSDTDDDEEGDSASAGTQPSQSTGSTVLSYFVGLILLAMIAAVIYAVLKSRGVTAKGALEQLGVVVPPEGDTPADPQTPASSIPTVESNVCPFCGQQKDADGKCACSLDAAPQTPGMPAQVPAQSSGQPKLVGSRGPYAMHIFELLETGVIGRDPGCRYPLPEDATVSRRHATITVSGAECSIKDEGSANGVTINGAKVTEQTLRPGDEVRIGETSFRFEV